MDSFWALVGAVAFGLAALGVFLRAWDSTHKETRN